jgi:endonuclease/exonuclease/phosphatase family metal-dependent hydrolase
MRHSVGIRLSGPATAHRKLFIRYAASILLVLSVAFGSACVPFVKKTYTLRVLVFNIHAGKDAGGRDNLADVAQLARSSAADVVLLQEVDRGTNRSGKVDQLQALIDATRYGGVFARSLDYDGGQYGIAALSREGFVFNETVPLPVQPVQARSGGSHEPRVALVATAQTTGGRLQMVNTHLDASADESYRLQEIEGVLNAVRPRVSQATPVLVGGDFNSEPASAVVERLLAAGLRDAWAECGQGDGFTYPADQPTKRIDYVFLTGSLRCTAAEVIDSRISDHRPLLITLADIAILR